MKDRLEAVARRLNQLAAQAAAPGAAAGHWPGGCGAGCTGARA